MSHDRQTVRPSRRPLRVIDHPPGQAESEAYGLRVMKKWWMSKGPNSLGNGHVTGKRKITISKQTPKSNPISNKAGNDVLKNHVDK